MENEILTALMLKKLEEKLESMLDPSTIRGTRGLRGANGVDGKSFNFEEHEETFKAIAKEFALKFEDLTEEQIASLKGPRGNSGRDGKDFSFAQYKDQIELICSDAVNSISESMKLKFSDLSEEEVESLRGPKGRDGKNGEDFSFDRNKERIEDFCKEAVLENSGSLRLKFSELSDDEVERIRGPKGRQGKDFNFEEHREFFENLKPKFSDFTAEEVEKLRLHFSDLTEEDRASLKLRFSELTDEERTSLKGERGARGQRGGQGSDGSSAYQIALSNGFSGSEVDWLKSLEAKDGLDGKDGVGIRGIPGPVGPIGISVNGEDGRDGEDAPYVTDIRVEQNKSDEAEFLFDFSDGTTLTTNAVRLPRLNVYNSVGGGLAQSSSGGSLKIGAEVKDGTAKEVLYADNSGDLISDSSFTRDSVTKEFKQSRTVMLDETRNDILLGAPTALAADEIVFFADPSTFIRTATGKVVSSAGSNVLITLLDGNVNDDDTYENEAHTESGVVVSSVSSVASVAYEVGFISDDLLPSLGIKGNACFLNGINNSIVSGWVDLSDFGNSQFSLLDYVSTPTGNASRSISKDSVSYKVSNDGNSEGNLDLTLTEANLGVKNQSSVVSKFQIEDGKASYSLKGLKYEFPSNAYASPPSAGQYLTVDTFGSDIVKMKFSTLSGSGISSINSQTGAAQTISVGTSGTDVNVDNATPDTTIINIPDAAGNARGLLTATSQSLAGEKSFGLSSNDRNNFTVNLLAPTTVFNTYNNPDDFYIAFYPFVTIEDDEDHDGNIVGGLISSSQQGNGNLNALLAGIAFTVEHGGSGTVAFGLGVSGAVNTNAGSIGNFALAAGGNLSVEHEGDGVISNAASLNAIISNFGGGDILNASCVNAKIESDGATGDIVDGYVVFCETHDALNKYGVYIDVEDSKNLLHQLTLKAAFDIVPNDLTDDTTIATDAALSNIFDVTLEGNRTLGNPANARDGQELIFRIRQDVVGGRTLTLDSKFRFGVTLPSVAFSITASALDYLTVRYNLTDDTFDVIDFKGGF